MAPARPSILLDQQASQDHQLAGGGTNSIVPTGDTNSINLIGAEIKVIAIINTYLTDVKRMNRTLTKEGGYT